eukprot:3904435-Amphidinium_carterae.1
MSSASLSVSSNGSKIAAAEVIPGVVYSIQSRASCAGSGPVHSNVSVAPWIDKDDPVNNSVIEVQCSGPQPTSER